MHRRLSVVIVALLAMFVISPVAASPVVAPQCFSVPGITNCIDGRFSSFWNGNGGLPVFGYPITPQRDELNADLQKTFSTQWFERNRFEQHPELAAPYDVLLGRLGAELLQAQGRDWHNEADSGNPLGGSCQHFNDTNRDVCGPFLTYWKGHGLNDPKLDAYGKSLALFGLPLTGVKLETNPNGDTVLTQWFERARFELHPEVGNIVLLGLLGHERLAGGTPAPTPTPSPTPVPAPSPTPAPDPCSGVPDPVSAHIAPSKCVKAGTQIVFDIFGFQPNEQIGFWLTDPQGRIFGSPENLPIGPTGAVSGVPFSTADLYPGLWYLVFKGTTSQHQSVVYFKILP